MKDLISNLATAIISTGIGSGATYIMTNTTCNKITSIDSTMTTITSEDKYEIHWTGKPGDKFIGSASILYPDHRPVKSYVINETLPHKYKFSAIKNTTVSAIGVEPGVKVRILKNGIDCGQLTSEGNAIGENRICY